MTQPIPPQETRRSAGTATDPPPSDGARARSDQIQPPVLSLPKGGGVIRGVGEKFSANPVTGTGSMAVPIAMSPGRSGFGPQLSLTYDSGAGSGAYGFGWRLFTPAITRKADQGMALLEDLVAVKSDPDKAQWRLTASTPAQKASLANLHDILLVVHHNAKEKHP